MELSRSAKINANLDQFQIGAKLRRLRLKKSMGLRELSGHTGLSPAMLSKLERGVLVPTLASLLKVAAVFSVELGHFFDVERQPLMEIVRRAERLRFPETVPSEDASFVFENLNFSAPDPQMNCYIADFQQFEPERCRPHSHAGIEFLYLVEGSLELVTERGPHTLEAGDAAYFDSSELHAYRKCDAAVATTAIVITIPGPGR